MSFKC